ncbi:MAG: hypothetical protein P8N76_00490 [Pirellulaceae bacterium]|nr:hypothetical protein [Pirellulaceae bacterium]
MRSTNAAALRRYFAGVAEHTFQTQIGVADPPMIDYISDLLTRFVRCEAIFRVRNLAGRPIREVAEMMVEAEERVGNARREVHRHIGDFTLFWTGVYPEAVPRFVAKSQQDHLVNYCAEGKRSYLIASRIETDEPENASNELLERLSREFELCAYGLREVRRHWENHDGQDPPQPFLIN